MMQIGEEFEYEYVYEFERGKDANARSAFPYCAKIQRKEITS